MNESFEVKRNILHLTLKLINGECFAVTENLDKGLKVSALHARLQDSCQYPGIGCLSQSSSIMYKTPLELSAKRRSMGCKHFTSIRHYRFCIQILQDDNSRQVKIISLRNSLEKERDRSVWWAHPAATSPYNWAASPAPDKNVFHLTKRHNHLTRLCAIWWRATTRKEGASSDEAPLAPRKTVPPNE